jgi:hypothetical protein
MHIGVCVRGRAERWGFSQDFRPNLVRVPWRKARQKRGLEWINTPLIQITLELAPKFQARELRSSVTE